jgi:Homeodomain-like domain
MLSPSAGGDGTVIKLGEVVMTLDLRRQGLSVSAIADHLGIDRKTVRKYIARGLKLPAYGPRQPRPRASIRSPHTCASGSRPGRA